MYHTLEQDNATCVLKACKFNCLAQYLQTSSHSSSSKRRRLYGRYISCNCIRMLCGNGIDSSEVLVTCSSVRLIKVCAGRSKNSNNLLYSDCLLFRKASLWRTYISERAFPARSIAARYCSSCITYNPRPTI